jgi:hypothetical protein
MGLNSCEQSLVPAGVGQHHKDFTREGAELFEEGGCKEDITFNSFAGAEAS